MCHLGECYVAAVGERCYHQPGCVAQILVVVLKLGVTNIHKALVFIVVPAEVTRGLVFAYSTPFELYIIIIIIIFVETRLQNTIGKIIQYRWLG